MRGESLRAIPGVYDSPLLTKWQKALELKGEYGFNDDKWLFRGHENATWTLRTSYERAREGGGNEPAWKYEATMLREFTRRAYHYLSDLPPANNTLEWFALMRHFGAPSRLLDCTYSFYAAAYFALSGASPTQGPAAVWAVSNSWLKERFARTFPADARRRGGDFRFKSPADFKRTFLRTHKPRTFAAPVNPFRLNQRLTAQHGVFLCPGDITKPFMQNLLPHATTPSGDRVVRILLDTSMKTDAIRDLGRMNVSAATLFPDLGGFALSLRDWFHRPLNFIYKDLKMALDGHFPGDRY